MRIQYMDDQCIFKGSKSDPLNDGYFENADFLHKVTCKGTVFFYCDTTFQNAQFKQHASLVMVFLTVLASVPLVYSTMKLEEKKDRIMKSEKSLLIEHSKALVFQFERVEQACL